MRNVERFRDRYAVSGDPALLAAEFDALGTDYSANGYTTPLQAEEIGDWLALGEEDLLLDVGAGCGWPGLYLAKRHGCTVISLEPVPEGMPALRARASVDGCGEQAWPVVADAVAIPLRPKSVDAIVHADVLC